MVVKGRAKGYMRLMRSAAVGTGWDRTGKEGIENERKTYYRHRINLLKIWTEGG